MIKVVNEARPSDGDSYAEYKRKLNEYTAKSYIVEYERRERLLDAIYDTVDELESAGHSAIAARLQQRAETVMRGDGE